MGGREAKLTWKKLIEKGCLSGSSQQLTLKKGAPTNQVQNLLCVQLASNVDDDDDVDNAQIKNLIMMMIDGRAMWVAVTERSKVNLDLWYLSTLVVLLGKIHLHSKY